jgi:2-polyprenyl-3-methyl-5-hydroxy-6-metoxy-1,4-benzoquinol methylase
MAMPGEQDNGFTPHEIEWQPNHVKRMWAWQSRNAAVTSGYFSNQVGDAVIDLVNNIVPLKGKSVLDFGCGPGFLVEKLAKRGIKVTGLDYSAESLSDMESRVRSYPSFVGGVLAEKVPSPLPSDNYDVVFFLDVIEHILPDEFHQTLGEIARVVRRGGHVVVSTNNNENLEADKIMCPECGCTFHRVQHVSSWSRQSLAKKMSEYGFVEKQSVATILRPPSRLNPLLNFASKYVLRTPPYNLIYVGRKQ